ncbi:MAG: N-acetylglucosamine-6-phosphate deacetylase, partial [Acidimicrobiales bacterium]
MLSPGVVEVDGGQVVAVGPARGPAPDRILCPGFVDLQVNGHEDLDVTEARGADWDHLDLLLVAQGVTAWCQPLISAPLAEFGPALEA